MSLKIIIKRCLKLRIQYSNFFFVERRTSKKHFHKQNPYEKKVVIGRVVLINHWNWLTSINPVTVAWQPIVANHLTINFHHFMSQNVRIFQKGRRKNIKISKTVCMNALLMRGLSLWKLEIAFWLWWLSSLNWYNCVRVCIHVTHSS